MTVASIDVGALLELAWVAPLAAIAVSLCFSLVVLGATRAADSRRAGASAAAFGFGALALFSALAFATIVITGVGVIVAK